MTVDLLEVLKKVASCRGIQLTIVKGGSPQARDFDTGVGRTLLETGEMNQILETLYKENREGIVYFVKDYFEAEYCVLRVPESEPVYGEYIFVGPYRDMVMTNAQLTALLEEKSIPREYANELQEYFSTIPVVAEIGQWRELCMTLAQMLYGGEPVQSEYMSQSSMDSSFRYEPHQEELSFKVLEQRSAAEGEFLKAVSNSNVEGAMLQLNRLIQYQQNSGDRGSARDRKNVLISMNALMRKAAEAGGVHPAHVDGLFGQISRRIEAANVTDRNMKEILADMTRKYCMLVRNYSLRGYSPVIQKVVNHINLNLSRDLSLKRLSVEYSVNASYLSALFKKEMGMTLTDYISQQRIRHAITLLNSTSLQIQDIASESGIYDVNYFRKLFKKITGKTPTEYARQVRSNVNTAAAQVSMAK